MRWSPNKVTYFTSTDNWLLEKTGTGWTARRYPHDFGEPMMIPLTWKATNDAPFGKSRINGSSYLTATYWKTYINTVK